MRLISLLCLCVLAVSSKDIFDGTKKLLLSQIMWRHGDRSPTKTYAGDQYQEDAWKFGGTGWGQLSPKGMSQHMKLGKRLRSMYVDTGFLSPTYNSHEIYIRSTDVNRTIISAMSNMIGMYGQANYTQNRKGIDYPDDDDWPATFIPIAAHTVEDDTDYIGNADATCMRQKKLWSMAKQSPELQAFQNTDQVISLLANLTTNCKETITIDNLWIVADAFLIENIYNMQQQNWYSSALNDQTVMVNDQVELYQNGVYNNTIMMNGIDVGLQIQMIRGGSITNDINMHMNIKLACQGQNSAKCKWINNLKYYVYSAHDTTLYAFFSCLGIQSKVVTPHGYPKYSAAAIVELWQDTKDNSTYFKMLFHDKEDDPFKVVTADLAGCPSNSDYCPLSVYQKFAARVKPLKDLPTWCQEDPTIPNTSSSTTMPPSTTSGAITTTAGIFSLLIGTIHVLRQFV